MVEARHLTCCEGVFGGLTQSFATPQAEAGIQLLACHFELAARHGFSGPGHGLVEQYGVPCLTWNLQSIASRSIGQYLGPPLAHRVEYRAQPADVRSDRGDHSWRLASLPQVPTDLTQRDGPAVLDEQTGKQYPPLPWTQFQCGVTTQYLDRAQHAIPKELVLACVHRITRVLSTPRSASRSAALPAIRRYLALPCRRSERCDHVFPEFRQYSRPRRICVPNARSDAALQVSGRKRNQVDSPNEILTTWVVNWPTLTQGHLTRQ